jgi:hypothetical protein
LKLADAAQVIDHTKISLKPHHLLYRVLEAIPPIRDYDRLYDSTSESELGERPTHRSPIDGLTDDHRRSSGACSVAIVAHTWGR